MKNEQAEDNAPGFLSQYEKQVQSPGVAESPGILRTTFNLIISLLFVIGLIYVFMILLKFFYVKASIPMKAEGVVKVLAKEYVDNKKIMYVVEFGEKILLLGSAGETLNVLTEINEREEVDRIKDKADEYIAKYRLKNESKFSEELKSSYLKQGKKLVKSGNEAIKNVMDKLKKKDKK